MLIDIRAYSIITPIIYLSCDAALYPGNGCPVLSVLKVKFGKMAF